MTSRVLPGFIAITVQRSTIARYFWAIAWYMQRKSRVTYDNASMKSERSNYYWLDITVEEMP
jgi:hypothetical protein